MLLVLNTRIVKLILTLTLFVTGVLLTNHPNHAFTADNFAVLAAFFNRGLNFHDAILYL